MFTTRTRRISEIRRVSKNRRPSRAITREPITHPAPPHPVIRRSYGTELKAEMTTTGPGCAPLKTGVLLNHPPSPPPPVYLPEAEWCFAVENGQAAPNSSSSIIMIRTWGRPAGVIVGWRRVSIGFWFGFSIVGWYAITVETVVRVEKRRWKDDDDNDGDGVGTRTCVRASHAVIALETTTCTRAGQKESAAAAAGRVNARRRCVCVHTDIQHTLRHAGQTDAGGRVTTPEGSRTVCLCAVRGQEHTERERTASRGYTESHTHTRTQVVYKA